MRNCYDLGLVKTKGGEKMAKKDSKELSGKQKAAILLISLGPDVSASIYKHLSEEEIEKLTLEISSVNKVDSMAKEEVVEEFHQIALAQDYIAQGGIGYAKTVLEKALGEEQATVILNRLTSSLQVRPFDFARKADPAQILNFIQNEHPQTIALILSYLNANRQDKSFQNCHRKCKQISREELPLWIVHRLRLLMKLN